jgi:hypothetical protein
MIRAGFLSMRSRQRARLARDLINGVETPGPTPRRLGAALVATLLASGCGGGGGGSRVVSRLSGLVATIDTGSPVVDASVTVDGTNRGTRTTGRGSYFLDAVDVGRGWRTVRAEKAIGGEQWNGERAVFFDRDVPIQSNLLITIGPETRKGTLRGRVTTGSGVPLENVTVFLNPETSVAAAFRVTDSNGRYEFRGVPSGTYTVVASARDLVNSGASQVPVTAGATATADLAMLVSSGSDIGAPGSLQAQAFTYPETRAALTQTQAVTHWLRARQSRRGAAHVARRFRIQDWPAGSIIEVSLSWTAPSATDLAGYVLDRAVGGGSFGTIDRFADPTASAYYDLDPIYTPEETYQFRLSAVSTTLLQSAPSNTVSVRPLAPLGGLTPAPGSQTALAPAFSWSPVPRAQRYQLLVLSRPPELTDVDRMPLVWPPADNLAAAQTGGTQLVYGGPPLQAGSTYYWLLFAFDQSDTMAAQAVSASAVQRFMAQ